MATKQQAMKAMAKFGITLDGPHVTRIGWEGMMDAPEGHSFGGQFKGVHVGGLSAEEFWRNVVDMARLDGPEICADDRDEI